MTTTTRARLKLVAIIDASVRRTAGSDVVWFDFKPLYKNFGPSPAEDTSFEPHIFIVGTGPSPKEACKTGAEWMMRDVSPNVVFPQDEGGDWTSVQVPLQELKKNAAKVLAIQPSAPVYLGVVGCLLYRSGSGTSTYVTGFVADLHMTGGEQDDPEKYIPLYDVLVSGSDPAEVGMNVKILSAWAD